MMGTISTAVLAGIIGIFFMIGVKKIINSYRKGNCCGSGDNDQSGCGGGCSSCGCHSQEKSKKE